MQQINQIFFPLASKESELAKEEGKYFAYYTTAETAHSIITNKVLWMRNTTVMNDYREVLHGADLLMKAINSPEANELREEIDKLFPGLSAEAIKYFSDNLASIKKSTYITCFSMHDKDDANGRLSMWRGYGGNSGIALIFKPNVFLNPQNVGIYASPVTYGSEEILSAAMDRISKNIQDHKEEVKRFGKNQMADSSTKCNTV